jgi:hypothetical protein
MDSFRNWLIEKVKEIKKVVSTSAYPIYWYDPKGEWKEILELAFKDKYNVWFDFEHQLKTRYSLMEAEQKPDIVVLPMKREKLDFLKTLEPYAHHWEQELMAAIKDYGVNITHDLEPDIKPLIKSYSIEWMNESLEKWRNLTATGAELVNERIILESIINYTKPISDILSIDRFEIFVRRLEQDYGITAPRKERIDNTELLKAWRTEALSCIIATDINAKVNGTEFTRPDKLIKGDSAKKNSLQLLNQIVTNIEYMTKFDELIDTIDKQLGLEDWIRNNYKPENEPLYSYSCEKTFFNEEVEKISSLENIKSMDEYLDNNKDFYKVHSSSYWSKNDTKKVDWELLVILTEACRNLSSNENIASQWTSINDCIEWYKTNGWKLDIACELSFDVTTSESVKLNDIIYKVREAYLRILDKTNTAFSEQISKNENWHQSMKLDYSGEILLKEFVKQDKTVIIVADALRLDMAKRIEMRINENENDNDKQFAKTTVAKAPVPSITSLGMPLALPIKSEKLELNLEENPSYIFERKNLSIAEHRRDYFRNKYKLQNSHILSFQSIRENNFKIPKGKLLLISMDEIDRQGHEGELELTGADDIIERFIKIIRISRDQGYNKCIIVTDHGYFHYLQDSDEIIDPPKGDIKYKSRRAYMGHNLTHDSAIKTIVKNFECITPRSISAFKTYGRKGFYHGGTTLQELLIPVVTIQWSKRLEKIGVIIKPISEIATLDPKIEVESQKAKELFGDNFVERQFIIKIRVANTSKLIFISKAETISSNVDKKVVLLSKVQGAEASLNSALRIEAIDADNEELLSTYDSILKIELDEWL